MKKKIMRQIGGTCGYYAIVNSLTVLFPEKYFSHKDVYDLLRKLAAMDITNVGEMFTYPPNYLFEEYFEDKGLHVLLEKRKISRLKRDLELLEEDSAIIISTPSSKTSSHLIGVVRVDGNLRILDSNRRTCRRYNYKYKNLEKKHRELKNRVYSFKTYFNLINKINRIFLRLTFNKFERYRYKDKYSDYMIKLVNKLEKNVEKNMQLKIEIESGCYLFLKKNPNKKRTRTSGVNF